MDFSAEDARKATVNRDEYDNDRLNRRWPEVKSWILESCEMGVTSICLYEDVIPRDLFGKAIPVLEGLGYQVKIVGNYGQGLEVSWGEK